MKTEQEILSDDELSAAWGNANFGAATKREVVANTLLKCASGFHTGSTARAIVRELDLVKPLNWALTKKGKEYLFSVFSNGQSF